MRRSTRRRFETYRKQTRTLTFDDEARSETLRIIQAMRTEQARSEAVAAPDAPAIVQTTKMASPARKRREPQWASMRTPFALKAAACAVVAVGIALFAVAGITPAVDKEHSIATASSPLLPYQRIQFDHNNEVIFEASDGVYIAVPILLTLPGNPEGGATVSLNGAENTLLSTEWFPDEGAEPGSTSIRTKIVSGQVNAYAVYRTSLTHADFVDGGTIPSGWTWDPTDAINMIEDLRNCEIVVTSSADRPATYTIDFDDYPTREDIAERLYSRVGFRLTYFSLDRNED